ncbi:DegV family protein [Clostridium hominis]|nr:DegV family protein [Clostridium sp.]
MNKIILMTDSCCDLPYDFTEDNNLVVIPLRLTLGDMTIADDLGKTLKYEDFYKAVRGGEMPKTAQANVYEFEQEFEKHIKNGDKVIYIGFSSALSGTYNSANIAMEALKERYSDADISVIDSKCASMGLGLLVYYANNMLKEGKDKEEIVKWVEENKLKVIHWFTVEDLNHLYRGGRVSKATATVGTLLSIKPVMHVDNEGRLIPVEKARGRKKSLSALVNKLIEEIVNPEEQVVFISHGDCIEDVEYVKEKILEKINVKDIVVNHVGPVIGTHSGPGTVAIFYFANGRE